MLKQNSNVQCVVDTNILYFATNYNGSIDGSAIELLNLIKRCHILVLDHLGRIKDEYQRCKDVTRDPFIIKWYNHFFIKVADRTFSYNGKISMKHSQALKKFAFHDDDEAFLGAASNSLDKLLIYAQDGDYSLDVRDYAKNEMGVNILRHVDCL